MKALRKVALASESFLPFFWVEPSSMRRAIASRLSSAAGSVMKDGIKL